MRARTATLIASLACASGLITTSTAAAAATACANADALPSVVDPTTLSDATLCLLNERRAEAGLGSLRNNRKLTVAAAGYSTAMVREGFFAHVSPAGQTLEQRLSAVNYIGRGRSWVVGENIGWATGQNSTPNEMVAAWMNSEGHRRNILDGSFREIGIGIVAGTPNGATAVSKATYTTEFGTRDGLTAFAARRQADAERKARKQSASETKAAKAAKKTKRKKRSKH